MSRLKLKDFPVCVLSSQNCVKSGHDTLAYTPNSKTIISIPEKTIIIGILGLAMLFLIPGLLIKRGRY